DRPLPLAAGRLPGGDDPYLLAAVGRARRSTDAAGAARAGVRDGAAAAAHAHARAGACPAGDHRPHRRALLRGADGPDAPAAGGGLARPADVGDAPRRQRPRARTLPPGDAVVLRRPEQAAERWLYARHRAVAALRSLPGRARGAAR